ncbi:MAG: PBP1A family penicillin-binding protein [Candidatus Berkelbacteria bacterium]
MYKFKNYLKNLLNNRTVRKYRDLALEKYRSEEGEFWKERIFGIKHYSKDKVGHLILRFLVWCIVFTLLLFIWFSKDLPTPGKIVNHQSAQAAQLFDRNGKTIYTFNGTVRRINVPESDIPQDVRNATITAEDRNFYKHMGLDFKGIARAIFYDIFKPGSNLQGGSTITQQYVKNALLDPQQTVTRKIKEAFLSIEIELMYSKDQILTMYLNEIPYGSNAYGIEAASQTFFNKHAKDLTLAEAATLAALPQRPTYFSPYGSHPDRRLVRVNYILDSMVDLKYTTREKADKAKEEAKNIEFAKPSEYIAAPHFAMYVKDQLVAKFGEKMVDEGGLKVITTLDLDQQAKAEDVITAQAAKLSSIKATNAALVAINPTNGQILSMIGSIDYFSKNIDGQVNVADSLRQPGSSFKPIVYATAFKDKYNPGYTLWDVPTDFGNYKPQNYDGTTRGPVTMRQALAGSLNIPAVKTLYLAGLSKSLETAKDMGITTLTEPDRYGLSLVLGGGEIKLVELVNAYGVFANNGKYSPITSLLKVENAKGNVLYEYKDQTPKQVLDPQIAYEISSILSDNNARSYVFGANSALNFSDRQVAVKTGTTSEYRDAWTVGYTPQLVTGVWVGNNNNTVMTAGAAGAMAAAPIWHNFMQQALAGQPNQDFIRPAGITDVTVDKISNKLPTKSSPETITDIFASWQVPTTKDDIHQKIKIDKVTGNIAPDDCPDAFAETKVYTKLHSEVPSNPAWEGPVIAAAQSMGINIAPPTSTTKSCTTSGNKLGVRITKPNDHDTVGTNFNVKVTTKSRVKTVALSIDGETVKTISSTPYGFAIRKLANGDHSITAVATSASGVVSSDSISITVNNAAASDTSTTDTTSLTAPDNVSNVSLQGGSGSATLSWTNPATSNLKSVNIYSSTTEGELGSLLGSINVSPLANSTTTISSLISGQNYWFTLRPTDTNGNENSDSSQYKVTIL